MVKGKIPQGLYLLRFKNILMNSKKEILYSLCTTKGLSPY